MKRAIRIIIPFLLAVAILFSIGWYFLEYDPEFTRDLLLQQARRLEKSGNMSAAVWFYDLAYQQSKENDQVAIELAEQFKAIGNYTKAEYTLSKAIEDGGTLELYTALCKTYVEQNKILDAVQMLDKISNPAMKAELDALRPAAPTASIKPGHYSQYLTVHVEAASGQLYVSLDKEYPAVPEDAYTDPITLSGGSTTIWAVSIADNGLVSPLSVFDYTVDGVIEAVTFTDAAVEKAVREKLGITHSDPLYSNELWNITDFTLPTGAVTCQDLAWMRNLERLTINGNVIDSLDFLANLQKLQMVTITNSVVSNEHLKQIAAAPALVYLDLSDCSLSSIDGLKNATGLTTLILKSNNIRDTEVLGGMTKLTVLNLSNNAVVNLEHISLLTELTDLDLSYNSIVSTAPMVSLTKLTALSVSGNGLMQLEGIETLTGLQRFEAAENKLVDISVLAACTELTLLNVSNNTLLDIGVISNFPKLQQLNFAYNEVTSLPGFAAGCPLLSIDGSHNQLSSLASLSGLSSLQYVVMDYNSNISSVDPLASCPALILVNVYATRVTSVHILTDRGVIVNYKPL